MTNRVAYREYSYPNDNWTRVELFRLVNGRLPEKQTDLITHLTLRAYVRLYLKGKLPKDTSINTGLLYEKIVNHEVLTSLQINRLNKAIESKAVFYSDLDQK